jgi:phosphoribosylglycinamide formyltransferase-1
MRDMQKLNLGFLASGHGSLFQAVIDACSQGRLSAHAVVLVSNRGSCQAFARAVQHGVPAYDLSLKTHPDEADLDAAICSALKRHAPDLIILAGYLKKLGPHTLAAFSQRVINIHPALLPMFGGKGMYGIAVHEAVIRAGERETGITIHLVADDYDEGPILDQTHVPVFPSDTPDILAGRVHRRELRFLVEFLSKVERGDFWWSR